MALDHSFQCWGIRKKLSEWEFKCGHRLKELGQDSIDWHRILQNDVRLASKACPECKKQGRNNMAEKKLASGAAAFRDAIENKKLMGEKAKAYIAKATGKEFTEAKFVWYGNLYKEGKLGGIPAELLKAKAAKKAK